MSAHSPLVSVVTATYNWSSVLRYAIQSVLWQTFTDFEYLIVGDGCTDDSAAVVASFGDPRLRWHNLSENSGNQSLPNNTGIGLARGQYIAYLGHDDLWHPTHLERLVRLLQDTNADLGNTLLLWLGPPETGVRKLRGCWNVAPLTEMPEFCPPSCWMHKRALIDDIGEWKDYRTIYLPPDREFWQRAWKAGKQFAAVHELTVFKFTSGVRPNAYREKPSHEQAEYVRRMQHEPDFLYREMIATAAAYHWNKTEVPADYRRDVITMRRPGWLVENARRRRGLDPRALPRPSLRDYVVQTKKVVGDFLLRGSVRAHYRRAIRPRLLKLFRL